MNTDSIPRPVAPPVALPDPTTEDLRLTDLITRCQEALARGAPRAELLGLIEEIADVNRLRFRAESLASVHPAHTGSHRRQTRHGKLLEQLTRLLFNFRAGESDTSHQIQQFLADWRQPEAAAHKANRPG